ncbi:hypothetical protein MY5147_007233 [Beauveria neobassiana]
MGGYSKNATRFAEQSWMLMYYSVFWPIGMYLYYNSKYFGHMDDLWTEWPQREIDVLMKAYILGQWSIWIQQFLVINMEERRKDHWQMLTHHLVTSTLLAYCYAYHQTRVGSVILVLLDVIDLFLPLAKCLKHLGFGVICDVILADLLSPGSSHAMASTFLHAGASMFDLPRILKEACYCVSADNLQGPFTVPTSGWSHLLEPFRDPKGVVCFNNNIINSEAEELGEEREDVDEAERPQYLQQEVDAEAINWTARASAAKMSSSGGSLHFRGYADPCKARDVTDQDPDLDTFWMQVGREDLS